jgi:hypothetical protein
MKVNVIQSVHLSVAVPLCMSLTVTDQCTVALSTVLSNTTVGNTVILATLVDIQVVLQLGIITYH